MLTSKITHKESCVGEQEFFPYMSAMQFEQVGGSRDGTRERLVTHELEMFSRYIRKKVTFLNELQNNIKKRVANT